MQVGRAQWLKCMKEIITFSYLEMVFDWSRVSIAQSLFNQCKSLEKSKGSLINKYHLIVTLKMKI